MGDRVFFVAKTYEKICEHPSCGVEFTVSGRGAHLRRYCDEHYVGNTAHGDGHGGEASKEQKRQEDRCSYCGRNLTANKIRRSALYCGRQCRAKATQERSAERAKQTAALDGLPSDVSYKMEKGQRGESYRIIGKRPEMLRKLIAGSMSQAEAARQLDTTEADISRSMNAHRYDNALKIKNGSWVPPWTTRAMVPTWKLERVREIGPGGEVDELVGAYAVFSRKFFRLEGKRPLIEEFHLKWIRSIIVAYAVGGKQLILSPPRHGKSEMLIRFVVWLIVMFPNIRIMWVAASSDVAEIMLGAVKDHLENNEDLITATLPPGRTYKPERNSGKKWTAKEIKVEQQDHVGQKSSSLLALGRTAKILSRDVDLLVTDDIEDFDTTREPSQRRYSRNKLAEIGTRKEEKTGWLYIASRQHGDDIPQHIMQLEGTDQAWRTIVDSAHSECQLDPDVYEGHDENGCVLFPKIRSYRWLMEKKSEMEALGIPGAYEMRYLNQPIPETGIVFDIPLIREVALDRSRDLGVDGLPPGTLVGGLDPAARGTQAAFCWHFGHETLSMVDLEEQKAGGFEGAWAIMRQWHADYGLMHWFYESNSQQSQFFEMKETKALALELGLVIKPHWTGKNKIDPEIGISAMAPWYHGGRINLPYGSARARKKVNTLLRQLELWTTDGIVRGKKKKTDIKMASWFPFPWIVKKGQEDKKLTLHAGQDASYPGISSMNQVGWQTPYPGGK